MVMAGRGFFSCGPFLVGRLSLFLKKKKKKKKKNSLSAFYTYIWCEKIYLRNGLAIGEIAKGTYSQCIFASRLGIWNLNKK